MILHHDAKAIEVDEQQLQLMRAYHLWVDVVRNSPGRSQLWEPSDIDIMKSRLFWRIRSGYRPLPWAPPVAYSCPWYEVVEDMGNHSCFECWRHTQAGADNWVIAQCVYRQIEQLEDNKYILGYGEYRFIIFRDVSKEAKRIADLNPHSPDCEQRMLSQLQNDESKGWFIRRMPELEIPQPEVQLSSWAQQLKPHMSSHTPM